MMWLAKLTLSQESARQANLTDDYDWHQFAWTCLPFDPNAKRDFLTRVDWVGNTVTFFLLSERKPVKPESISSDVWHVTEVTQDFLEQPYYDFSLKANPIKQIAVYDENGHRKKNNKKIALRGKQSKYEWFQKKAKESGFELIPPLFIAPVTLHDFMCRTSTVHDVGVEFQGRIKITDQKRFIDTFKRGIGSSKAFGFGMLLIKPYSITQEQ